MSYASINEIVEAFNKSNYHIYASGNRNLDSDELYHIINILLNAENPLPFLNELYANSKSTIELDKSSMRDQCPSFDAILCDCFLPEVDIENCYCQIQKRIKLEDSDYRGTKEYKEWRLSVFERDDYMCQECKWHGGTLNAHHIKTFKDYPKLRYKLSNGTTLCYKCHKKLHKDLRCQK